MIKSYNTDIVIIGSGPIGLFTIFQAGMLGMKCQVIDILDKIGGQCVSLYPEKPIYDIPGYPVITGKELINKLIEQSQPFSPVFHLKNMAQSIIYNQNSLTVITNQNLHIECKAVIIAAGCGAFGPNRPPLANIENYEGTSIFYHIEQISQFHDKTIVIAGGGDSAADWALELSKIAKKVYLVHRRKSFRCAANTLQMIDKQAENGKIQLMIPYQLECIQGNDKTLHNVVIKNFTTQELISLPADFLLPFFGTSANLGPILNWGLNIENHRILVDPSNLRTNLNRVYAVGDIVSYPGKLKLILNGFAEVAMACHDIFNIVFPNMPLNFQYSTSKGVPALTE